MIDSVCCLSAAACLLPPVCCCDLRRLTDALELDSLIGRFENNEVSVIELGEGSYEIGREAETAEICLPIPTVSGRHALLRLDAGSDTLYLTDLGSTNGTYINGKEIERNVETAVKSSDVIVFGDSHLASFIYDASSDE